MGDASWKAWERRCAKLLGGVRRGADTRGEQAGKSDVVHEFWAPEVKLLSRPAWSHFLEACRQAERNAGPHQVPLAIVRKKFAPDGDALVCFRLSTFEAWFLGASADEP